MNEKHPTVVVPWDFSDHAKASLAYAYQHYADDGIRVICVLETPNPYGPGMNWGPEIEQSAIESCVKKFFEVVPEAKDSGLQFFAEFGDPAEEIVKFAKRQAADFIVMSTHGRAGFQRIFMGSVAQKVVVNASSPVVLLPNSWFEQQSATERESVAANES